VPLRIFGFDGQALNEGVPDVGIRWAGYGENQIG
jgi:hypothetical protein